jgi:hypothetical protein
MKRFAPIAFAAAFVFAACSSPSEVIAEQLAEQVDGVDNVEIDSDTGEVRIETDDGSLSIGGGDLPDDFSVSLPDGYRVTSVYEAEGDSAVSVIYPPGGFDDVAQALDNWVDSQPGEWRTSSTTFETADGETIRSMHWSAEKVNISVTDCPDFTGDSSKSDSVCVNVISGS